MAETIFGEYKQTLDTLSRNANKLYLEVQEATKIVSRPRTVEQMPPDRESIIYSLIPQFITIFNNELAEAIQGNREYGRHSMFKTAIERVFEKNVFNIVHDFLIGVGGIGSAYEAMDKYAGDMSDFYTGVEFARNLYTKQTKKKMRSPKQRAVFWRRFVWGTDTWVITIRHRFNAWRNKAPFWIWLEHGNETHELAHPHFYGTLFFYKAMQRIKDTFNSNLPLDTGDESDYILEFDNIVYKVANEVVMGFLLNPSAYTPGQVLQRFYYEAKQAYYEFRVTPRGRLGLRKSR